MKDYDDTLVRFMKDFTIKYFAACRQRSLIFAKSSTNLDPTNKCSTVDQVLLFSVSTFWSLIQDDSLAPQIITDLALTSIQEILRIDYCISTRIVYITKSIENLKENISVPQSLHLVLGLYSESNNDIQQFIAKYNLVEILLKSCEHYLKLISTKLSSIKMKENIGESVYDGKYSHKRNLDERLKFFEFALLIRSSIISQAHIFKLWSLFIIDCKSEYSKQLFLNWLSKDSLSNKTNWLKEESNYLFEIISNSRSQFINSLEEQYYNCFVKFFKLVNLPQNKADNVIIGIDSLWECVSYSQNENIRHLFSELLVSTYLNWNIFPKENIDDIYISFIDFCMNLLKSAEKVNNHSVIANLIRLLILFIETADGKKYSSSNSSPKNLIEVMLKPGNVSLKLEIIEGEALGFIKKRIANAFNIPFEGFSLCSTSKDYNSERNDTLIKHEDVVNQLFIQQKVQIETPKAILANNKEYIDLLFSLLAKENALSVNYVWDLLMIMPLNVKMRDDIFNYNVQNENLLDCGSIHKFIYSLQIVQEIIIQEKGNGWLEKFCHKGGLAHLFKALLNIPTLSFDHPFIIECFELLFNIFSQIRVCGLNFSQFIPEYNEAMQLRLIERITRILEGFAQFSSLVKDDKKQEKLSNSFLKGFDLIESTNPNYFIQVVQHIKFKDLLNEGLVLSENNHFQNALSKKILTACESSNKIAYSPSHPHAILLLTMINTLIHDAVRCNNPCTTFYKLLKALIKQRSKKELNILPIDYHALFKTLANYMHEHYIAGLLDILRCLLKIYYEEKEFVGQTCGVVKELLESYLFSFLQKRSQIFSDRTAAFKLLCTLAQDSLKNKEEIIKFLFPLHR